MQGEHYKIQINGEEFDASEYQDKIFQTISSGVGNLIINAAAGSAKTTTIVNAIRFIPDAKKMTIEVQILLTNTNIKTMSKVI